MAQPFVCEAWRRQQLQTLNLTKMSSFAKSEEIQELCDVVPSVVQQSVVGPGVVDGIGWDAHLTLWSPLSSLKLARMEALSF